MLLVPGLWLFLSSPTLFGGGGRGLRIPSGNRAQVVFCTPAPTDMVFLPSRLGLFLGTWRVPSLVLAHGALSLNSFYQAKSSPLLGGETFPLH